MKKLRLCSQINLHGEPGADFNEYVREGLTFHKNIGFDAADYPFYRMDFLSDSWRGIIENAIKVSDDIGVHFEVSHLPFNSKIRSDEELLKVFNERMYPAIDAAAYLKVGYAVVHPNTITLLAEDYNEKRERDTVLSHLSPFVDYAEKRGVKLVVENMRYVPQPTAAHRYCQSAEELCDIADTLGVGICWDFGHANLSGVKQSEALAYIGKRLKMLHVHDNKGIDDDHIVPFFGKIDWRDAMHGLALAGYEGLFNYELIAKNLPKSMRAVLAEYLHAAADELMSYII